MSSSNFSRCTVKEILVPLIFILCVAKAGSSDPRQFDVMSYGADGDGATDDSKAFGKAWDDLCGSTTDQPTLLIPEGKTFLLVPVKFKGPCNPSHLQVQLDGNLTAPKQPWDAPKESSWIEFAGVKGLIVNATGQINGQGTAWWQACPSRDNCRGPTALRFQNCSDLQVWGLKSFDSPRNHISIDACNNVRVSDVYLSAPMTSPNTDGIDIFESTNIQIQQSIISTGDDCVAINSGTSNINITGVKCGPGHGISVGSLGISGSYAKVEGVHVFNCSFIGTQNGARIKTWQGGSGYARNIKFENIALESVNKSIFINQFYCPHDSCKEETSAVNISDVWFTGFNGTSLDERAITLNCSRTIGCTNINLNSIQITAAVPGKQSKSYCINAHGTSSNAIPPVDCLMG